MGKNKLAKFAQLETYPHVFQYPFARLQREPFPLKGRWREEFFGNDHPIILELGCGKGEYTVGLGERYPECNFIGIDIKGARMWTGAKASLETGMNNVAFLRTDIELLRHFFAEGEVSEIWITFPDPQMKRVGKRLTSTRFIELYLSILQADGLVHLKTDSPFLYTYTSALLKENGWVPMVQTDDLYHSSYQNPILEIQTYYERQWLSRGFSIKYIQFAPSMPSGGLVEPEIEIEHDSYRSFGRNGRVQ